MSHKIWHKTEITTEEQNVSIYPTEDFDETKELDDKTFSTRLYLKDERNDDLR